ncbi:MAG: GLPGLI family protein [Bacteroidia bacterium]|nr:GLPGLI family protein [Bacteroidia bacterium]
MKAILSYTIYTLLALFSSLRAQSFYGTAQYDLKLYEDAFYFEATLAFNNKASVFTYKQHPGPVWARIEEERFKSQWIRTDSLGHIVYRRYDRPTIQVRSFCREGEPMVYEDLLRIDWQLGNREETIQGLPCKNAHATFRGRKYEAWYTLQVPLGVGPWKFFGLPGLIVKISDQKQEISILLRNLALHQGESQVSTYLPGATISREDFYTCLDEEWVISYEKK